MDRMRRALLEAGVQRLKNLRIFSQVEPTLEEAEGNGVALTLNIKEIWTLMPHIAFQGGGGTTFLSLGAFDINTFGRAKELGVRVETFGRVPGAAVWAADPRFWDGALQASSELSLTRRARSLYEKEGSLQGGFLIERSEAKASLRRDLGGPWNAGAGIAVQANKYSDGNLTREQSEANARSALTLPREERLVRPRAMLRLGGLDYESYLRKGAVLDIEGEQALPLKKGVSFRRYTATAKYFLITPLRGNLASRFAFGSQTSASSPDYFYLGGLDSIRGLKDGQVRGSRFWLANAEFRIPSYESFDIALQHAIFFDAGDAAKKWNDVTQGKGQPPLSVGTGVRLIAPQIFGAVFRLDYAWVLKPTRTHGASFAIGQFF